MIQQKNFHDFDIEPVPLMAEILRSNPTELSLIDFMEMISLKAVRERTSLWVAEPGNLIAFAFVDEYWNLRWAFQAGMEHELVLRSLEPQIFEWGKSCVRAMNQAEETQMTLDACCEATDSARRDLLERNGFIRQDILSLLYEKQLDPGLQVFPLPEGFRIRPVEGEREVDRLVHLHRSAFGTDQMTAEYRLAMMRTETYDSTLDLVIEDSQGDLAGFCVCQVDKVESEQAGKAVGFTDPIGIHPEYQGRGLGKAVLTAGLSRLREREMEFARLGTSSENLRMQRLAESVGFQVISEKIWYSLNVE